MLEKIKISLILYVVLSATVILFLVCSDSHVETKIIDTTVIDSVSIDSLTKRISFLESLPPIIVTDTLVITVPTKIDTNTYRYTFPYEDSLLTAKISLDTFSEIKIKSVVLDYTLERDQKVVKETTYITNTIYQTRTIETVNTLSPKPYLTVGLDVGTISFISPSVGFVTRDSYHFRYMYDVGLGSHRVGVSIPIKLF